MENQDYNTQEYNKLFKEFAEKCEAIRQKYRIKFALPKEDVKKFRDAKEGDLISRNPEIPNNPKEAFELFKNYYAEIQFELQKNLFLDKYKTWNIASIKSEIAIIEKWINESIKISYSDACKEPYDNNNQHEYLRLINGFYDGYLMTWTHHNEGSLSAQTYGRYVLFYDYLKQRINDLQIPESRYIDKVEIDFINLPQYIIKKGIIWRFEKMQIQDCDYSDWRNELLKFLGTIPEEYILNTISKGIEYGLKVYEYHKQNECSDLSNCIYNESWERRITLARQLENEIKISMSSKESESQQNEIINNETNERNSEFTTARQVLALHLLFDYLQIRSHEIDRKVKAEFAEFLTGKSYKNIYDAFQNPFVTKQKKFRFEDLQYVRTYFENLGLSEIVKAINNQLDKPK